MAYRSAMSSAADVSACLVDHYVTTGDDVAAKERLFPDILWKNLERVQTGTFISGLAAQAGAARHDGLHERSAVRFGGGESVPILGALQHRSAGQHVAVALARAEVPGAGGDVATQPLLKDEAMEGGPVEGHGAGGAGDEDVPMVQHAIVASAAAAAGAQGNGHPSPLMLVQHPASNSDDTAGRGRGLAKAMDEDEAAAAPDMVSPPKLASTRLQGMRDGNLGGGSSALPWKPWSYAAGAASSSGAGASAAGPGVGAAGGSTSGYAAAVTGAGSSSSSDGPSAATYHGLVCPLPSWAPAFSPYDCGEPDPANPVHARVLAGLANLQPFTPVKQSQHMAVVRLLEEKDELGRPKVRVYKRPDDAPLDSPFPWERLFRENPDLDPGEFMPHLRHKKADGAAGAAGRAGADSDPGNFRDMLRPVWANPATTTVPGPAGSRTPNPFQPHVDTYKRDAAAISIGRI